MAGVPNKARHSGGSIHGPKATEGSLKLPHMKTSKVAYSKLGGWGDLVIIIYHDAAWANVPNEMDHEDFNGTKDTSIYSQLGYVVVIAHKDTLLGKPGKVCWLRGSHTLGGGCAGAPLPLRPWQLLRDGKLGSLFVTFYTAVFQLGVRRPSKL